MTQSFVPEPVRQDSDFSPLLKEERDVSLKTKLVLRHRPSTDLFKVIIPNSVGSGVFPVWFSQDSRRVLLRFYKIIEE